MAKLPTNKAETPPNTSAEETTPDATPENKQTRPTNKAKPAENLAPKANAADAARIKSAAPATKNGISFRPLDTTEDYVKAILWGREGSAKTTSACHAANRGRVLVINVEGGLKLRALQKQGVNTSNLMVWPDPEDPSAEISHQTLEQIYYQVKADLMHEPGSWYAVIIDSITELTSALVGRASDIRTTRTIRRAESQGVAVDEDIQWETDRNDYGVMGKQFRDLLRKFRDLPCHLILTALERRDVDEDTGVSHYGPAVSPGIQQDVLGYMDLVLYHKAAEEDKPFRAVTHKSGRRRSKDRYGSLPQVLNEPTFERVLDYLNGDLDAATDPLQTAETK